MTAMPSDDEDLRRARLIPWVVLTLVFFAAAAAYLVVEHWPF